MKPQLRLFFVVSVVAGLVADAAQAAVTVSPATGGTGISADSAQNGATPNFAALGDIVIEERAAADFTAGTNRTLVLSAPTGWQIRSGFGTATATKLSSGGGPNELVVNSLAVTNSSLTVNLTVTGTTQTNRLTVSGLQGPGHGGR